MDAQSVLIPEYSLVVPNVFTPEGDGNNDDWILFFDENITNISSISVLINDQLVFNGEDLIISKFIFAWDGSLNGKTEPGVYNYKIKIKIDSHDEIVIDGEVCSVPNINSDGEPSVRNCVDFEENCRFPSGWDGADGFNPAFNFDIQCIP